MRRKLWTISLSCLLLLPMKAWAGDATKKALSIIPADAVGFVCVPNIKQLDADFQRTVNQLGLQGFVAPPFNSVAGLMRQFLGLGEGFDENGPVAIVFMPAANQFEFMMKQGIIIPASDPRKLLEGMGATPGEGGVWSANVMGKPYSAVAGENRIVLSPMPDVAKAIAEGKGGIASKFDKHDLVTLENLDVVLWLDGERLLKTFKQQIDGLVGMMGMMQAAQGPTGAAQAEMTKKQVDMLVDGMAALGIGIGLGEGGLTMRMGIRAKKSSELGQTMKVRPTRESLLRGLPGDDYLFAAGATVDPSVADKAIAQLDGYFAMAEGVEGIDTDQLAKLKDILKTWAPMSTGFRVVFSAIAPGANGMFGAAAVWDTKDSAKWLDSFNSAVETAMKLPKKDSETLDAELKDALNALTFERDAQKVAGADVSHLRFNASEIEEFEEEWLDQLQKLLGKDGFLIRVGAATSETVVLTFGGGADYFTTVVEQTRSKAAPLEGEAGIQSVSSHLPKERYSVGYFDVDRIIKWIGDVVKVMEEDDDAFPVKMPPLDAPLAIASNGGDGWQTHELYVPNELMIATKDAVMGAMAGGGSTPPPPPPPGGTE